MVVAPSCLSLEFVILNESKGSQNRKKEMLRYAQHYKTHRVNAILFLKNFDKRAKILWTTTTNWTTK